ncbi:MAG: hypothetical protein QXY45_04060 [Candidatus Aenigmatarchaeota archaeon]
MPETFLRTIRKSGSSSCINIPKEIVRILDLKKGDLVKVTIEKVESKGEVV